jgi:hypothetical protein
VSSSSISAVPGLPRRPPASRPSDPLITDPLTTMFEWCKVCPAQDRQANLVGDFIAGLVTERPDHREITAGAADLAATVIEHAARAGHGFFVAGMGRSGSTLQVAAAPLSDSGKVVRPVLYADFGPSPVAVHETPWPTPQPSPPHPGYTTDDEPPRPTPQLSPPLHTQVADLFAQIAALASRYPGWHIWFGPATREWWAMPRHNSPDDQLICAPTTDALASRLSGWVVDQADAGPSWASQHPR